MSENGTPLQGRRAAVVDGLRTPFVKAGTDFRDLTAVELGALAVNELLAARSPVPPREVDSVVFGQVVPSATVTLIGREMVLRTQLSRSVEAHTVSRACATSIQAATDAADQIRLGHSDCVIAGGAEAMSDAPIFASRRLAQALIEVSRARPWESGSESSPASAAGLRTGSARAQGAHHRPHHGRAPKRWRSGTASRALPRTPSRCRAISSGAAWEEGRLDAEVIHVPAAAVRPRGGSRQPGAQGGHPRGAGEAERRSSTGGSGRSPPAIRRPSPMAQRCCCC